jgi:hypothetical protein
MIDLKAFGAWLVLCLVAAGVTVVATEALDKAFGLQQTVAKFGK